MRGVTPFADVIGFDQVSTVAGVLSQLEASPTLSAAAASGRNRFGYLFPELQNPADLLPTSASTVQALKDLGDAMSEPGTDAALDSDIPSAYAHFGQFVDHDIVLMNLRGARLSDPDLAPLPPAAVADIENVRDPRLDLESVYADAPHAGGDLLRLGKVKNVGRRPQEKEGDFFDLPRSDKSCDPLHDRVPHIGERRNNETTIIGQMHVAFLRAHNSVVRAGYEHCAARSLLRHYYQSVIVHDFLPRVADPAVVAEMLAEPWAHFNPDQGESFMPLEFSAAAFRFGHSMVRNSYRLSDVRPSESLLKLFSVLGRYPRMPDNWIIQWENFLDGGPNRARFIDTRLAQGLFTVPGLQRGDEIRLPVRTLLRGYQLSLPTGQAVARALGLKPAEVLTESEIEAVAGRVPGGAQLEVVREERTADNGSKWKLSTRTPLWFYILAEAEHSRHGLGRGHHLGPVGSRLVAGVLVALVRASKNSILKVPGWPPARDPGFKLSDLLRLARVL